MPLQVAIWIYKGWERKILIADVLQYRKNGAMGILSAAAVLAGYIMLWLAAAEDVASASSGPGTSDGTMGSATEDDFSLVGPFTTWRIEIRTEDNPGLDLSKITEAYMEFDCQYRAI